MAPGTLLCAGQHTHSSIELVITQAKLLDVCLELTEANEMHMPLKNVPGCAHQQSEGNGNFGWLNSHFSPEKFLGSLKYTTKHSP